MTILRRYSQGPDVSLLQLGLTRSGYRPGSLDGIFGPMTENAVKGFQVRNGLAPDGIVGPQTWRALLPYLKGYTVYSVRQRDTLRSIRSRFGSAPGAIATANPMVNFNRLQAGQTLIVPLGFSVVPTNIPYTSTLLGLVTEGLLARYPFMGGGVLGQSVMGTNLPYLVMGSGPASVFYNAAHHANEWITTPVLLKYLEEYAQAYATGSRVYGTPASILFRSTTLYMAPMVNPDGVDLVTGAIPTTSPRYREARRYASRYPAVPFPQGWKANIQGVDLNLQYPAGWENAQRIKFSQGYTQPGPRDYVGPRPLSQPESAAIYRFTREHDFSLTLSYHSQGRVIYWRFLDYEPPRSRQIALLMGRSSGYSVEDTPYASGFAGYKDWFIQDYNRPGYTIEVGLGESPLPLSQFDSIYRDNVGILTIGMTQAT